MNSTNGVEILLVEDNPYDVELTLRALKMSNLADRVSIAKDGAEALDYLFAQVAGSDQDAGSVPKVVLLDLKLPKVSGLEVLRAIKSDDRTRAIPVVILTSSQEEKDMQAGYALGANSYIVKPMDYDSYVSLIGMAGLYWLGINKSLL